jgi:hypothetical protein
MRYDNRWQGSSSSIIAMKKKTGVCRVGAVFIECGAVGGVTEGWYHGMGWILGG